MNKYWFRPKTYGYGFTPKTWEGWLASLCLVAIILLSAYANSFFNEVGPNPMDIAHFLVDMIIIISISMLLFSNKTDGNLGWKWGNK